jgi:excisionase family DNA binding protein
MTSKPISRRFQRSTIKPMAYLRRALSTPPVGQDRKDHLISCSRKTPAMARLTALPTEESDVDHATSSTIAPPGFYLVDEVANSLGYSTRTIRRWINAGKLRAYRFGRTLRIAHDDLQDFLSRHEIRRDGDLRPDLSRRVTALNTVGKTPNK